MRSMRARTMAVAVAMVCGIPLTALPGWSSPACPLNPVTDAAKSHKLFLYFPTVSDPTFQGRLLPTLMVGAFARRKLSAAYASCCSRLKAYFLAHCSAQFPM